MIFAPTAGGHGNGNANATLFGELEGVGEQVLEHLLQTLGVGDHAARQVRVGVDVEGEAAIFRFVAEGARDHFEERGEENFFGFDGNGAGFDFGEVENIADEVEQVCAGAVNGAGEFDLFAGEVAVGVFGELLAENQNAVERRAQLVGHVGEEFRFVFGGEGQLFGFFFESAASLLDFLVFAFDFDVLFGELLSFLGQLFVGLLQLFLLGLQLGGQLLRLLQQAFRLHGGFNTVQHDADVGGELFEEGQVRGGEFAERGQLDNSFDAILEENGKDDDVLRDGFEQAGGDRDGIAGNFLDEHAALFRGTLSDEAFADAQVLVLIVGVLVGVGGELHKFAGTFEPSGR